jgi:hypothetical protein
MKWLQRLFGWSNDMRRQAGREYARAAIQQGPYAIALLQSQIDADVLFGTRDAFTDGAREALDQWTEEEKRDEER